ncbi:MAG: putative phosphoribosyl transferase [Actinomycetota bacterium]|jgi:putative phosphoribosyl transferase
MPFRNRSDAGRRLAHRLVELDLTEPIVLALPRGGVPVAAEVAVVLGCSFDVFVARKIGAPGHDEYGIGAVAEGRDEPVVSDAARQLGFSASDLAQLAATARRERDRRVQLYRGDRALPDVARRNVVVVDDGLATGVTAEAALTSLRQRDPARLVLAVPVCAPDTAARLRSIADDVVCVEAPERMVAVGRWYDDFAQTTDDQVLGLLATRPSDTSRAGGRSLA